MFSSVRRVWSAMLPVTSWFVAGSIGTWPETNRSCPARIAWEYGPSAFGAESVETAESTSGGLDDFVRTQAPGADADAAHAAVNHRADKLQVRLESARTHVMSVADDASHDRLLPANITTLGHYSSRRNRQLYREPFDINRLPSNAVKSPTEAGNYVNRQR